MSLRNLLPHRHRWTTVATGSRGKRIVAVDVYCGRCPKRKHFAIEPEGEKP